MWAIDLATSQETQQNWWKSKLKDHCTLYTVSALSTASEVVDYHRKRFWLVSHVNVHHFKTQTCKSLTGFWFEILYISVKACFCWLTKLFSVVTDTDTIELEINQYKINFYKQNRLWTKSQHLCALSMCQKRKSYVFPFVSDYLLFINLRGLMIS